MHEILEKYYASTGRKKPDVVVGNIEEISNLQWLQYRQQGIGGSDANVIVNGGNTFNTVNDIAHSKLDPITEESVAAKRENETPEDIGRKNAGHVMEPVIREWIRNTMKIGNCPEPLSLISEIFEDRGMYRHHDHKFMIADCDDFALFKDGRVCGLEYKTKSYRLKKYWKSGTYGIDAEVEDLGYVAQVYHYMTVMDLDCYILVMSFEFSGSDNVVIFFNRDDNYMKFIVSKEEDFWNNKEYYLTQIPERCTEEQGERLAEYWKTRYAHLDDENAQILGEAILEAKNQIAQLNKKIKQLEEAIEPKERALLANLGDGLTFGKNVCFKVTSVTRRGNYDSKSLDKFATELKEQFGIERKPSKTTRTLKVEKKYSEDDE